MFRDPARWPLFDPPRPAVEPIFATTTAAVHDAAMELEVLVEHAALQALQLMVIHAQQEARSSREPRGGRGRGVITSHRLLPLEAVCEVPSASRSR